MADIEPNFPDTDQASSKADARKAARKRGFLIFAGVVALVAAGVGIYEWIEGGRYVETDNAYVAAEVAQVTPLVAGPVRRVAVNNTQVVRKGDVLVELDPTDAKIALAAADAERITKTGLATAETIARQAEASGGAHNQLTRQIVERLADALEKSGVDIVPRIQISTGGEASGIAGGPLAALIGMMLGEKGRDMLASDAAAEPVQTH